MSGITSIQSHIPLKYSVYTNHYSNAKRNATRGFRNKKQEYLMQKSGDRGKRVDK